MNNRLPYLFSLRVARQPFDAAEEQDWITLISDPANQVQIEALFTALMDRSASPGSLSEAETTAIIQNILGGARLESSAHVSTTIPVRAAHRVHFLRTAWVRYAAAVLLLFGIGAYVYYTGENKTGVVVNKTAPVLKDVLPGSEKAVLTLSDGRTVELGAETRAIADAGVAIRNVEGRVEYGQGERVVFNTMTTPRGGQYQLVLPDGSKVWLNAASSITYPTAFTGKTREVEVEGEAYFEVAKNKEKPFIVKSSKETVTVLGTEFNINTYEDEPYSKTSLITGSIKVNNRILNPGQAFINGKIITTDLAQDMAWKNGEFNFADTDIKTIMRQLEKWYNIQVNYEGHIDAHFVARISRQEPLSEVLKLLALTNLVEFTIKGKTVTVSQ